MRRRHVAFAIGTDTDHFGLRLSGRSEDVTVIEGDSIRGSFHIPMTRPKLISGGGIVRVDRILSSDDQLIPVCEAGNRRCPEAVSLRTPDPPDDFAGRTVQCGEPAGSSQPPDSAATVVGRDE